MTNSSSPVHPRFPRLWTIVPAAGVGRRMGGECPKQYLKLGEKTILEHTLERLLSIPGIDHIWLPVHPEDREWQTHRQRFSGRVTEVAGGTERADSVLNAMKTLQPNAHEEDWVLVHDVARPCIRKADVANLIARLADNPVGGLLAVPVADTLKRAGPNNVVEATVLREHLWRAYTPQLFRFGLLLEGLTQGLDSGVSITDEASAIEFLGHKPMLVEGHSDNIKITHPQDLRLAQLFLERIQQEET